MVRCSDLSPPLCVMTGNNSIYHKHGGGVVPSSVDKCSACAVAFEPGCKVLSNTEGQRQQQEASRQVSGTDCTQIKTRTPQATSGVYLIQPRGVHKPFKSSVPNNIQFSSKIDCTERVTHSNTSGYGGNCTWWKTASSRGTDCKVEPELEFTSRQHEIYILQLSGLLLERDKLFVNWCKEAPGRPKSFLCALLILSEDHWLGLMKVFLMTKDKTKKWTLRVDLWDHEGGTAFAEYQNFRLGNKKTAFKLHVGHYSGNAGDAIRGAYTGIDQNGFGFSTIDRDNDGCSPCIFGDIGENECASSEGGGWWYSRCGSASLNGDWHPAGHHIGWASGVHWLTWKRPAPYSAKASRMMIKSV
ncbi:hypothetical protein INR49_021850 [Caranx melampygus]|nr:hypothetical protein INR49_021850 [Caranx melampygus]